MNDISFTPGENRYAALTAPAADPAPPVPLLARYLRIVVRWKWLILGSIAVALLIGVVVTLLATPLYTSATRIQINREGAQIVQMDSLEPDTASGDLEFYQTQYGLLSSRSLAERVAQELKLENNGRFFSQFGEDEIAESLGDGSNSSISREDRQRAAVDILLENVEIAPIRLSRLVDIKWTSPDPELSTRVANAWAASFIQYNLERRFDATAYARRFLEGRLDELRGRLEESERELVGYASREAIINIPVPGADGETGSAERSLTADTLAALNAELAQAMADRISAESRLERAGDGAISEALANPAIAALRQTRATAAAEYSRLLTQFEPGYPAAQALAAQIEEIDESLAREIERVRGSIRNAYQDSVRRENALQEQLAALKQTFLDQRRRSIQYNIFQRDADTNRELYNGLLQRYKEIGVAGGVGENNVFIVDRAQVPDSPSYPRPFINLLLALLAGTAIGMALAFAREQINETIADPAELEGMIGIPLLGVVPKGDTDDPLNEMQDPKSALVEAYLSVQTNLSFSTDHGIPRTLMVTSTRPAEGKSTTSYAIASSIARTGAKTILLDGDMRSPSLHGAFSLNNVRGVSNFLAGTDSLDELIQKPEGVDFHAMTAGPQPPNAADLLRSDRFETLLSALQEHFDYVIIDSPPVMGLADAPIIASRTEGAIFVVEAHGVKVRVVKSAIGRLRQARANLVGSVLTKFDAKRAQYAYGYEYGYAYGNEETA